MARGKLILVCQYGGEFVKNEDGTMSYNGGEANAINVNNETQFDDLKLELAELCNLEYGTVSIKYFLPGNKKNLILVKNDKDLKRMVDFHGNSVTAEAFVMGKEGFDRDALKMHGGRVSGVKPTEILGRKKRRRAGTVDCLVSSATKAELESVMAVDVTVESPSRDTSASTPSDHDTDDDSDYAPRYSVPVALSDSPNATELIGTPASTVKRRRKSSWKVSINSSTTGNTGSRKSRKYTRRRTVAADDDVEQIQDIVPKVDNLYSPSSYEKAYNLLPHFCDKVLETNPGSLAKLVTDTDKIFRRLFVSFHAAIHGYLNGCRPLLFLEATSLKSKNREILLTATTMDGDDSFFPVAYAIVDVENESNWQWFLEELRSAISTSQSVTFVSDGEKGLHKAVAEVFSNAHHGYSMYHLLESFKKNLKSVFYEDWRGTLRGNLMAAAHATRLSNFNKFTEKLKQSSSLAYDFVAQIEPECWTNAAFKGERYNHIIEDVAEPYAKLMKEMREAPILHKIEALRSMMTDLFNNRRADSGNWSSKLTPSKERHIEEESLKAQWLKVLFSSDTLFEVHDDLIHVVNINDWECTCLGWKETGLPCRHAIAVLNCTGRSVYDYCSKYFTVSSFQTTYAESINPVVDIGKLFENDGAADLEIVEHVLPPTPLESQGEDEEEEAETGGSAKRTVVCSKCKVAGHNKSTCKANL